MIKRALLTAIFSCSSLLIWAQPIIVNQPTNQVVMSGSNVTFSIVVSGTGPFTYQWQFDGTNLPNNIITTVAGGGASLGDNGPATNASLYYPQGVGFDTNGNLFIADNNDNIVRMVDTNGVITTVAGKYSLTGSSNGDGAAATNAGLNHPNNVAVSSNGVIYIADIFNQRIRRVNTSGVISTAAGNGTAGSLGDGGLATSANLNYPAGVALDEAGNVYIADLANSRVRKVAGGIITTVAGKSVQGFSGDGGAATSASLMNPQGLNFDSASNLYIADTGNNRIRKVDVSGIITTVAGSSVTNFIGDGTAATNAGLNMPWSVCADNSGSLFIADYGHNRIRKVATNGIISTVAGKSNTGGFSGDGGPATKAGLNGPACVALDSLGNLYIADWYNNRIREIHFSGLPTLTLSNVSVASFGNYCVVVSSPSGSITNSFTLNVPVTPNFSGITVANGLPQFTWNSQSNLSYQLQYTTNLASPVWVDSGSRVYATSYSVSVMDDPGPDLQRYYRVQWEP